ncbi:NAD(P)H-dependent oxidoreductase [Lawsonia intracellularis]|nr:NAD(P)H-dependent oxidoreductase [Lawsonia intracellularis]KAA0204297.1 NAD(P)H-dependent oxidoreductase [Lawsonia intracellularis]
MNPTSEALMAAWEFRYACKEFDPVKKISEEDFHIILEGGRLSPSSFGFEPWEFLVVQNVELRSVIRAFSWGGQTQIPTASHLVIILARKPETMGPNSSYVRKTIMEDTQHLPENVANARAEKHGIFLKHDFNLLGNERACFEWVARQCYIPLANMMTAAAFLGIDSCAIEGFIKADLEKLLSDKGYIDPNEFGAACIVTFGYRKESSPPFLKTRRPEKEVVHWIN